MGPHPGGACPQAYVLSKEYDTSVWSIHYFFLGKKQKVKYINCGIIYLANVIIYMKLWLCEYMRPFSVSTFININNRRRKEGKIGKH